MRSPWLPAKSSILCLSMRSRRLVVAPVMVIGCAAVSGQHREEIT